MVAEATERHARLQLTYARHLTLHVIPYIGEQRVAEVSREAIHRLLTVVLKEKGASQTTILHTRTVLSAMLQMAWDQERRAPPVQGRSRGLGNGAGAHRASRNRPGQAIFPVRLFASTEAAGRDRLPPGGDRCPGLHR
ncbi:MAG TPA: hypothetical protein VGI05_01740 [Streptosporangiaceae bacterium]